MQVMQVMQVSFRPVLAKMADSQNRPASAILLRKSWNHTCITCITCITCNTCKPVPIWSMAAAPAPLRTTRANY